MALAFTAIQTPDIAWLPISWVCPSWQTVFQRIFCWSDISGTLAAGHANA